MTTIRFPVPICRATLVVALAAGGCGAGAQTGLRADELAVGTAAQVWPLAGAVDLVDTSIPLLREPAAVMRCFQHGVRIVDEEVDPQAGLSLPGTPTVRSRLLHGRRLAVFVVGDAVCMTRWTEAPRVAGPAVSMPKPIDAGPVGTLPASEPATADRPVSSQPGTADQANRPR